MIKKLVTFSILFFCTALTHADVTKMLEKNLRTVVKISVIDIALKMDKDGKIRIPTAKHGTGVFITNTGRILTCAHLFPDVFEMRVLDFDQNEYPAYLIVKDTSTDLAIIQVNVLRDNFPYNTLARNDVKIGQRVYAIGHPFEIDWTVSSGIVSALQRDSDDLKDLTQTDISINPGNSGGPLLNEKGQLVGINVSIYTPSSTPGSVGLSFVVSRATIKEFLRMYL
jgi:S1-C subfamily serine protease